MASKLLAGASRTASQVAGAARHLAWYVSYQLDLGEGARADGAGPDGAGSGHAPRRPGSRAGARRGS